MRFPTHIPKLIFVGYQSVEVKQVVFERNQNEFKSIFFMPLS